MKQLLIIFFLSMSISTLSQSLNEKNFVMAGAEVVQVLYGDFYNSWYEPGKKELVRLRCGSCYEVKHYHGISEDENGNVHHVP